MKTHNYTKIVGIDHGYGNIKTASTVTPTGITEYDDEPTFAGNTLIYEDMYYQIGENHKAFIADKVTDNDFYILTLMAIARELNQHGLTEADVHIAAGLPLTWVQKQREDFRNYLLKNKDVFFVYKSKPYNINIVGCDIFPQGYSAILDRLGEMSGVNMLADIGNGTMNVMYINNKKPISEKCWTEKLGVNQCIINAKNAVLDKFGVKIEETVIENIIRKGTADIGEKYLDCIIAVFRKYSAEIFETLRKYEYNSELMRLYIVGGGGSIIKHFGEYAVNRVTIINDLCAAAKGYEQIAYSKLKQGERHG